MQPPGPFPPPTPPSAGRDSPARTAATLTRQLARHGISRTYTAASEQFAVISATPDLTVWTNGQLIWCTLRGRRYTWAASDTETAAARLAALARQADAP